ncbi:response regulator transcription factor [Paenibacillus tuaregi]|uniref:response regulator transcription factor n=1 Tax=Paenibacillus tuaregi TaxID=1816681 RepID=UPI000838C924|nr:response regulator transcription factor [Paenibacillus tuaregi]
MCQNKQGHKRRSDTVLHEWILIVGELDGACEELTSALNQAGFEIRHTESGIEALDRIRQEIPTLVLTSTQLKDMDVFDFLRELKDGASAIQCPVIVLTMDLSTSELVKAFQEGAHDYVDLTRPPEELLARIRKLLELFYMARGPAETVLNFEDVTVHLKSRKAFRGDTHIKLTPKEYELLCFMLRKVNHVCSREELLQEVWGYDFRVDTNVVDVYIRHLRTKIDRGYPRKIIHTVRGMGYMIH